MDSLFPGQGLVYQKNLKPKEVIDSFRRLKALKPYDKKAFLEAVESVIRLDMIEGFEELLFLKLMKQILDVPSEI